MYCTRHPLSFNLPRNKFRNEVIYPNHDPSHSKTLLADYYKTDLLNALTRSLIFPGQCFRSSAFSSFFNWKKVASFSRAWIGRILRHSTTCFVLATNTQQRTCRLYYISSTDPYENSIVFFQVLCSPLFCSNSLLPPSPILRLSFFSSSSFFETQFFPIEFFLKCQFFIASTTRLWIFLTSNTCIFFCHNI